MIYTILGIETFKSKKGTDISILHTTYNKASNNCKCVEKFFILSSNVPDELEVGDEVNVLYGPQGANGFLSGVQII